MTLSIIIPTKDRGSIFEHTFEQAYKATEHISAQIIVINDSKTSVPVVPKKERVVLLNNVKSGVASARNIGAKNATGDILLFLDDDIIISSQSVNHLLSLHQTQRDACINLNWEYPPDLLEKLFSFNFGRFLFKNGMTTFRGWYNDGSWRSDELFNARSLASFHLSMPREVFFASGGYDESFPHAGFEDYDFPSRLKKAGVKLLIDTRVTVYHNEYDKVVPVNWLNNVERRAVTRKVGVTLGYKELAITYRKPKKLLLNFLRFLEPLLMSLLSKFPNQKNVDFLYFKLVSIIIAVKIFKGYTGR